MVDYKFATGEERKTPKLVGNPASLNLVLPLQIPTCQKQGINLMDKARRQVAMWVTSQPAVMQGCKNWVPQPRLAIASPHGSMVYRLQ